MEAGEDAARTAAREAEEESGWRAVVDPEHLVGFEPLPGQVTAPGDVFLWRAAERIGPPIDTEEVGRVEWVPLSREPGLVQRGELLGSGRWWRCCITWPHAAVVPPPGRTRWLSRRWCRCWARI